MANDLGIDYYTVPEAARRLKVSPSTIWRWIDAEKLPAYRIGPRAIRIKREDLDAAIRPVKIPRRGENGVERTPEKYVARVLTEDQLTRRHEAVAWLLAHRGEHNIAPLTTADLIHMVREERLTHEPPR